MALKRPLPADLTYGFLWQELSAKYGTKGLTHHELRAIHIKWKKLAAQVSV